MRRPSRIAAALFAFALLAAACGDDDDQEATTGVDDTPATEPTEATDAADAAGDGEQADGGTVAVAQTDLGEVLVDDAGKTLYIFENDSGGESTCYDECAGNWPPLTVDGEPVAGEGVDTSLLGTTERTDGSSQVTYSDRPLYRFAADVAPGDTNGQGVGDVWFVIGADGEPLTAEPEQGQGAGVGY